MRLPHKWRVRGTARQDECSHLALIPVFGGEEILVLPYSLAKAPHLASAGLGPPKLCFSQWNVSKFDRSRRLKYVSVVSFNLIIIIIII